MTSAAGGAAITPSETGKAITNDKANTAAKIMQRLLRKITQPVEGIFRSATCPLEGGVLAVTFGSLSFAESGLQLAEPIDCSV
jgi:hypothetical protein